MPAPSEAGLVGSLTGGGPSPLGYCPGHPFTCFSVLAPPQRLGWLEPSLVEILAGLAARRASTGAFDASSLTLMVRALWAAKHTEPRVRRIGCEGSEGARLKLAHGAKGETGSRL